MENAKIIAFYLPQFYPVEINDELYGKGFTEWRNVARAKPLFPRHYQPHIPADLGFYDLRVEETRCDQAKLAKQYGVDGFCYWHYWLGNGVEFLERPAKEMLKSHKPDFPFCLAWANHDWKANSFIAKNGKILIKQEYPGKEDYVNHFYSVLPYFKDDRYIKIDGKPIFMIYQPMAHGDIPLLITVWRELAKKNGLDGIFFIGHINNDIKNITKEMVLSTGVDAINKEGITTWYAVHNSFLLRVIGKIGRTLFHFPHFISYKRAMKYFVSEDCKEDNIFPSVIPNWDNTPRRKTNGIVLTKSSPELFKKHLQETIDLIKNKPDDRKYIFLKSWNEWAEGNYVEPDLKYGCGYLEAIKVVKNHYVDAQESRMEINSKNR